MVALVKIESGNPVGWMVANTVAELKISLTSKLCFDDDQRGEWRELADILPDDSDTDLGSHQYNGYWLLRS